VFIALEAWPIFLVALLVFGFAPGALLRVVVLAFRRDDPRRSELLAELHAVPRLERPFWVLEQLEVALFEGVWDRIVWVATGRVIYRWHLESGVKRNLAYPETFEVSTDEERLGIAPGAVVKLMFEMKDGWGERMWVNVSSVGKRHLTGTLVNCPLGIPRLSPGEKIKFRPDHVIDIDRPTWESCQETALDGERTPRKALGSR
jgi:hypothetical protein